jgi:hypothetical protein
LGYGVIGNTAVSGTVVLGSSPGTPANTKALQPQRLRGFPIFSLLIYVVAEALNEISNGGAAHVRHAVKSAHNRCYYMEAQIPTIEAGVSGDMSNRLILGRQP